MQNVNTRISKNRVILTLTTAKFHGFGQVTAPPRCGRAPGSWCWGCRPLISLQWMFLEVNKRDIIRRAGLNKGNQAHIANIFTPLGSPVSTGLGLEFYQLETVTVTFTPRASASPSSRFELVELAPFSSGEHLLRGVRNRRHESDSPRGGPGAGDQGCLPERESRGLKHQRGPRPSTL